jgi:hypothetical protein
VTSPPTGTELHFVIDEGLSTSPSEPRQNQVLQTLRLPATVCFLRPGADSANLLDHTSESGSLLLDPLPDGPQPRLLLLTPRGIAAPKVNGRRAPRVYLMRIGDQLLLDDGRLLHLTAFDSPRVGAIAEPQATTRCLICRAPFKSNAQVYTCPCGAAMHYDPAEVPEDSRLLCATLSAGCTSCQRSIQLEGGFRHVPDTD